jgi:methionyl aminopeptidase
MRKVIIKNQSEIKTMREGGKILAMILDKLREKVAPGITTEELNDLAEKLIADCGATPSFKDYCPSPDDIPYPTTLCASINEEVVHAPALPSRILKEGDIICLDLGLKYPSGKDGLFVDAALTVGVGKINDEAKKLIRVTEESLWAGIARVKHGNFVHDISRAVQYHAEKEGFSVVRDLVGHGVGHKVHEAPRIPNFFDSTWKAVPLYKGMTICIEPMVCAGGFTIRTKNDGWTVVTADGKLSAHFEHTVLVTGEGHEVLTK